MPLILVPNQFTSQPQLPVPLDKNHWLTKDVTVAINCATPNFNSATGKKLSVAHGGSGFSLRPTEQGMALWTPNGGWADFAVEEDWAGPNTIIAVCRVNSMDTWGGLFSKDSFGTGTQFAVGQENNFNTLYGSVENGTATSFTGSSISTLANFSVIAFTHSGVTSTAKSYYRNGTLVGSTGALGAQNTGTGVLGLGRSRDSSGSFDSDDDWLGFIRVKRVLSATEIARITLQNIWATWEPLPLWMYFALGGGPTTYFQNVAGSVTGAGALTKRTNKNTAGSTTFSGSIAKLTTKSYTGSMTAAGAVAKRTTKAFAGSITGSGALGTMILFTASLAGSLTPAGALSKLTMKALAGSSTLAGAITKKTFRTLDGNISMVGVVTKLTKKAFSGSVTVSGALSESYQVLKSLAGSITPTGALATLYIGFVLGVLKLLALMGVGQ